MRRRVQHVVLLAAMAATPGAVTAHVVAQAQRRAQPPVSATPTAPALLLTNAAIIDGTGAPAVEKGWIRIEGSRIAETGQGAPPPARGAQLLDLAGRTVVPGLGDMHVHLGRPAEGRWMLKLLLAHGITNVKEAGNTLGNDEALRTWTRSETTVPHLYISGVTINGNARELKFLLAGAQTRQLLENNYAFGIDFIKIHNFVSSFALKQIADFAKAHDLYLTGHVPIGGTSVGAIDAGMTILEHVRLRPSEMNDDPDVMARFPMDLLIMERENHWALVDFQSPTAQKTIGAWAKRKDRFFVDPTLVVHTALAHGDDPSWTDGPEVRLTSAALQQQWKSDAAKQYGNLGPDDYALAKKAAVNQGKFIGLVHAKGVRVLTGTDTPVNWVVPGASLLREIELLVQGGLTPIEAIQSSTGMVAQALRTKDRGTIAAGQTADLVIVNGNVATDIKSIEHIEKVVLGGRVYERQQLLDEAAKLAAADTARTTTDQ
jgi:hypothetical protein